MKPGKYTIDIYQGATFVLRIRLKDSDGVAINITGKKARMQVRDKISSTTVLMAASTTDTRITIDGAEGEILVTVPASVTAALVLGGNDKRWVYDVELYDDGVSPETVDRVLEGPARAHPEVTRV